VGFLESLARVTLFVADLAFGLVADLAFGFMAFPLDERFIAVIPSSPYFDRRLPSEPRPDSVRR
jgi:hypothetical protein